MKNKYFLRLRGILKSSGAYGVVCLTLGIFFVVSLLFEGFANLLQDDLEADSFTLSPLPACGIMLLYAATLMLDALARLKQAEFIFPERNQIAFNFTDYCCLSAMLFAISLLFYSLFEYDLQTLGWGRISSNIPSYLLYGILTAVFLFLPEKHAIQRLAALRITAKKLGYHYAPAYTISEWSLLAMVSLLWGMLLMDYVFHDLFLVLTTLLSVICYQITTLRALTRLVTGQAKPKKSNPTLKYRRMMTFMAVVLVAAVIRWHQNLSFADAAPGTAFIVALLMTGMSLAALLLYRYFKNQNSQNGNTLKAKIAAYLSAAFMLQLLLIFFVLIPDEMDCANHFFYTFGVMEILSLAVIAMVLLLSGFKAWLKQKI